MGKWKKCFLSAITISLIFLSACSNQSSDSLQIISTDYSNIERLSEAEFKELDYYLDNKYLAYQCVVSKTNTYGNLPEKLSVNNERQPNIWTCFGSNGYFLGIDYSEFASGILFFHYSGSDASATVLMSDRCVALLQPSNNKGKFCYAITSWNYFDEINNGVMLYRLNYPNDALKKTCNSEKLVNISTNEYALAATIDDDSAIYVATDRQLYIIQPDLTVFSISVPEVWSYLDINSMVIVSHSLYIGTGFGILEYDINSKKFKWFPMPFEELNLTTQ